MASRRPAVEAPLDAGLLQAASPTVKVAAAIATAAVARSDRCIPDAPSVGLRLGRRQAEGLFRYHDDHAAHRLVSDGLLLGVPQGKEVIDEQGDEAQDAEHHVDQPAHDGYARAERRPRVLAD